MYSMVLMAALTSGIDVPDFGRRGGGCCGCYGGYGGYGWGRGGCYGYGCSGWGGCYGGYGGGYASGGWGGGYGGGWGGGYGGWGGGYGGWGGYSSWGGYGYAPMIATYAAPVLASNTTLASPPTRSMYYSPDADANRRATVIVHLPANARLIVDGKSTSSTSDTRRFVSPPLEAGKGYHYIFKAEVTRDGQTMTTSKRVDVRAGQTQEIKLALADLDQASERKRPPEQPAERKDVPTQRVLPDRP